MAHDASDNNPVKESLTAVAGLVLLLVIIAGIGISAFLRPAGDHHPAGEAVQAAPAADTEQATAAAAAADAQQPAGADANAAAAPADANAQAPAAPESAEAKNLAQAVLTTDKTATEAPAADAAAKDAPAADAKPAEAAPAADAKAPAEQPAK